MKANANAKSLEGLPKTVLHVHCVSLCSSNTKNGWSPLLKGGYCRMDLSSKQRSWSYRCFGGCNTLQMSVELSMQRASWKKKYLALCLTVTRKKNNLTFCLQNRIVRLQTMKLHSFSDGMLLCSIYHLAFNFFPRVMGQWLESSITTSSCL